MKIADIQVVIKPFQMTLTTLFLTLLLIPGCSNKNKIVSTSAFFPDKIISSPLPVIPKDTAHLIIKALPEDKSLARMVIATPLRTKRGLDKDSLNIAWQAIAARAIERAYENRMDKDTAVRKRDSTMALLHIIQSDQHKQYMQSERANEIAQEQRITMVGITLESRIMLGFIIISTILSVIFRPKKRDIKVSAL